MENSRFKFRAWFNNSNDEDCPDWEMDYSKDSNLSKFFSWFENEDTHKIMQYTGLKDKNGVEIYEGDIVKVLQHEYNDDTMLYEDRIGSIEWYEYGFAIIREGAECRNITPCEMLARYKIEVIGNIYENKDLL